MYRHILIATDGFELATKALEHGLALAKREGAQVTIVTVTESWSALEMAKKAGEHVPNLVAEFEAIVAAAADSILRAAVPKLTSRLCSPLISTMLHSMCYRDLGAECFARRNPPKRSNRIHNLRQSPRFALSR